MSRAIYPLLAALGSTLIVGSTGLILLAADKAAQSDTMAKAEASQDVQAALKAEATGDNDRRNALLSRAIKVAPDLPEVNWHLASVRVGNRWLGVADVQGQTAGDPQTAEYRRLRHEAEGNPKLLRNLARWCTKSGWEDRARLHYAQLLNDADADAELHQEALQKLDLHNVGGSWVSGKELASRRDRSKMAEEAIVHWRPRLARLGVAIDGDDFKHRERAIVELGQIDDPRAIPALETFLAEGDGRFQEEIIRRLATFPDYAATEALVRFAVIPQSVVIRDLAIKALRRHSIHEYCPLLLNGLVAPIESQFEMQRLPNGVVTYRQSFTRDLPDKKLVKVDTNTARPQFVLPRGASMGSSGRKPQLVSLVEDDMMWRVQQRVVGELAGSALFAQVEATLANAPLSEPNRRIFYALREATGQQLPDSVGQWCQWWQDYNEYNWPKPTYCQYSTNYSQYITRPPVYGFSTTGAHSCFRTGTPVHAETGLVPIESIQPGDRVLAQDQDTGELKFKTVLRTTLRPPAKMLRLTIGKNEIVATLGHPFWVCGSGWKMAKQLNAGDAVHTLHGAAQIEHVEALPEPEQAYNLVVDGFNTYFVSQAGLLVHDNEYRKPTRAIVPGLIEEVAMK